MSFRQLVNYFGALTLVLSVVLFAVFLALASLDALRTRRRFVRVRRTPAGRALVIVDQRDQCSPIYDWAKANAAREREIAQLDRLVNLPAYRGRND